MLVPRMLKLIVVVFLLPAIRVHLVIMIAP